MAVNAVGLSTAIWNNNLRTLFLLLMFPVLVFAVLVCVTVVGIWALEVDVKLSDQIWQLVTNPGQILTDGIPQNIEFWAIRIGVVVAAVIALWYLIALFFHERMVDYYANARPVTRKEFPRVYNMLENLCISRGLPMPKLGMIDSPKLNAFASGITKGSFRITLTKGVMEKLDDDELEAVMAHELTHIINRDCRLIVIAMIFTGILAILAEGVMHTLRFGGRGARYGGSSNRDSGKILGGLLIIMVILWIGYFIALLLRSAVSKRREYMADAGAVQLTKNPEAMIRVLRKVSVQSHIAHVDDEVRMMMFDNSQQFLGLFDTHPTIDDRVRLLQRMARTAYDYKLENPSRRRERLNAKHPGPWERRKMGMGTKVKKARQKRDAKRTGAGGNSALSGQEPT